MTLGRPADRAVATPGAATSSDRIPVVFVQSIGDRSLEWTVLEVDAAGVPGAKGARCLLFTRVDCIRRVWHYPSDWRTLEAEQLAALSWQR